MIGAIETGGTKTLVTVASTWREAAAGPRVSIPTTSPETTLGEALEWITAHAGRGLHAVGIAAFGPLDVKARVVSTVTPKVAWRGFDWNSFLASQIGPLPIGFDTDVNAAVLAEHVGGAATGVASAAYLTVGTGIGGGLIIDGSLVHGVGHPEMGHMVVPRERDDAFPGSCPLHGDCLEGLASGSAIAERTPSQPRLDATHPSFATIAGYLASAAINVLTVTAVDVVVLGGGVMKVPGLLDLVRQLVTERLAGYLDGPGWRHGFESVLRAPELGDASGLVGAFLLGEQAATSPAV
mgnify:CR=1 FL=1